MIKDHLCVYDCKKLYNMSKYNSINLYNKYSYKEDYIILYTKGD